MKLVRFGAPGAEKPGLIDAQGVVRDLSAHVKDITGDTLSPASLDKLRKIDSKSLPAAPQGVRLGAPVGAVRNFIAVGLNYVDHAKETGAAIPKEPILFNKLPNCLVGPNDDVMVPKGIDQARLRDRDRLRDRHPRALRGGEERAVAHRRLLHLQRHFRAQLPGRARRAVDEGQVRGDVRAAGSVAGDARRDRGRAEFGHVARRQRRAPADREYPDDDLRHRPLSALHLPIHGAGGRRRGDDGERHPAWRSA